MFSILLAACMACNTQPSSSASAEEPTAASAQQTEATETKQKAAPVPTDTEFTKADKDEVLKLLADDSKQTTLDFARYFLGRPYVAYTLDGYYKDGTADGDAEHLVVNLREFDCLTLLETCNALAMAKAEANAAGADTNFDPWSAYCNKLTTLRYFGGHEDGYLSRIHYLSMSITDHIERGTMQEVVLPEKYTTPRTTNIDFMTKHAQSYYALKGNPALVPQLAELEKTYSGQKMRFLPQENCGHSQKELSAIHDGDILYIVTSKGGLDYSHQGYAFWGKDGHLHMLHASSTKKQVIADPLTLEAYLKGIPSSIGVRVFRLK